MNKRLGRKILDILKREIDLSKELFVVDYVGNDPFEKLVAIVLSQNTSDKNAIVALTNLKRISDLSPQGILKLSNEELEDALKPSGLQKERAIRLRKIAEEVIRGFNLKEVLILPVEEARRKLLTLPGIGKKSADVLLAIYGKKTIGVDTHAARVAKRIGIAPSRAGYEGIRGALLEVFGDEENLDLVHRYLIALGRRWCKAKKPQCDKCPLREICLYAQKTSHMIK